MKHASVSDTLADESAAQEEEDSLFLMAFGECTVTCFLLGPILPYPLHLPRSLSSHCLRSCWMCFIYFPIFSAPRRLCSSHDVLFLSPWRPISPSCLTAAQTGAQESVLSRTSHPRRLPPPAALVSRNPISAAGLRHVLPHVTCDDLHNIKVLG